MIASSLTAVLIIVVISAMLSGMEIAFVQSNRLKLETEKKKNHLLNYIATILGRHSDQYMTTILIGNSISLAIYAFAMSMLISLISGASGWSLALTTIVSAIIFILIARFIPHSTVLTNPNLYYKIFAVPAFILYILLFPIAYIATALPLIVLKFFRIDPPVKIELGSFDKTDLSSMLDKVADNDRDHENDKDIKLFQNALDFSDILIRDCMVPRVDIEAVDIECSIHELNERFISTQFSRLPVYKDNIDSIIGYVNTKSLFTIPDNISQIIKPVVYVPESMSAQRVLTVFIKKKHSVAVVIDEFGGTSGMVTIEDILEEIFGEIDDEHDLHDLVEKKLSENEYVLSGRLEIEYINEKFQLGFPESDEYDTLAGYIIYKHRDIPAVGDEIADGDKHIKILRADSSKVELIRLSIIKVN